MDKVTKWIALLLAGVMMSAALFACGGEAEDKDDEFAEYANMKPSELYEALLEADEYEVINDAVFDAYGTEMTMIQKLTKNDEIVKMEERGIDGSTMVCYYDYGENMVYTQDPAGNWSVARIDTGVEFATLEELVNNVVGEEMFDDDHYEDFDDDATRFVMKEDVAAEHDFEDLYIEADGTTYSLGATGTIEGLTVEIECTIEFKSTKASLPLVDDDAVIAITTAPVATTAPITHTTTTKNIITVIPTDPVETEDWEVKTYPQVLGDGLEKLLAGKTGLNQAGKIDTGSIASYGFTPWLSYESANQLFDGIDTGREWYYDQDDYGDYTILKEGADPENMQGGGPGKCGGTVNNSAYFCFALYEKATVSAYVITTGNDNAKYPGRNPVEWTLYATNDLDLYDAYAYGVDDANFETDGWVMLDYVYDGVVTQDNFAQCGYEIDAENRGKYQYYVWVLGYTQNKTFQACEFELYTG
ncbi:MAG: hypothetical protein IJX76_05150 [Clostridia bacterium]|nr:hypothetical protein [Clostridia bacterium]